MYTLLEFVQYYLTGIVFLIVFGVIGYLLLKIAIKHFYITDHASVFASLLTGLIFSITVFSIFTTYFKTINVGFLLLFLFGLLEFKKTSGTNSVIQKRNFFTIKKFLGFAVAYFVFVLWEAIFLFKTGAFPFVLPHNDFIFSSNISDSLLKTGYENFFMEGNFYNPVYHYMMPYHYFEIWINSFIVFFTGANNLLTFMLGVFPILYFTIWLGIASLFEQFKKKVSLQEYFLSFLLLFLGGFIIYLNKSEFFYNMHSLAPIPMELATKKYTTFYVFIIAALLLLTNKRTVLAMLVILSLSFVSITAFPPVLSGFTLFLLINGFLRLVGGKSVVRVLLYLLAVGSTIAIIYFYFNQSPFGLVFTDKKSAIISKLFSASYLRTFAHIVIGGALQTGILYSPLLIFSFFILRKMNIRQWQKEYKIIFLLFLSITVTSIFIWAILWDMVNATGFYASSLCYLNILFIFLFVLFYKANYHHLFSVKNILLGGFILLLCLRAGFAFYYNLNKEKEQASLYSDRYIQQVIAETKNKDINPYGASLMNYEKNNNLFSKNTFFIRLGQYLKFTPNVKLTTCINITNAPLSENDLQKKQEMEIMQLSVFYQFIRNQKKSGRFVSVEQSQADFIDQYHVNYLIVDKGVQVSAILQKRMKKEIADSLSGERFILLDAQ